LRKPTIAIFILYLIAIKNLKGRVCAAYAKGRVCAAYAKGRVCAAYAKGRVCAAYAKGRVCAAYAKGGFNAVYFSYGAEKKLLPLPYEFAPTTELDVAILNPLIIAPDKLEPPFLREGFPRRLPPPLTNILAV
jgi:hypothetical protein